jgi:heme/copper-type cytochrome/quinol oxidase subunit 2
VIGDRTKHTIRARTLSLVALFAVGVGTWACPDSERVRLPTEPAREKPSSLTEADLPARMPIFRVPRGGSPTPTPTRASSPTPVMTFPTAIPTRTTTPDLPSPTPTPTLTMTRTPTRTPTPGPVTISIALRGIPWQWDFYSVPGQSDGGPSATLHKGQRYSIQIFNDAPIFTLGHTFSGIAALGLSAVSIDPGTSFTQTFTPNTLGDFPFLCTESLCGVGHDDMLGVIHVVP